MPFDEDLEKRIYARAARLAAAGKEGESVWLRAFALELRYVRWTGPATTIV